MTEKEKFILPTTILQQGNTMLARIPASVVKHLDIKPSKDKASIRITGKQTVEITF